MPSISYGSSARGRFDDAAANSLFLNAFNKSATDSLEAIMRRFSIASKYSDIPLLGAVGLPEENVDTNYAFLNSFKYTVSVKTYTHGIAMRWNDYLTDIQAYRAFDEKVRQMGISARDAIYRDLSQMLIAAYTGASGNPEALSFDGEHLYDNHTIKSGTVNNKVSYALTSVPAASALQRGTIANPSPLTLAHAVAYGISEMAKFTDDRGNPYGYGDSNYTVLVPLELANTAQRAFLPIQRGVVDADPNLNSTYNVNVVSTQYIQRANLDANNAVILIFKTNGLATVYAEHLAQDFNFLGRDSEEFRESGNVKASTRAEYVVAAGLPYDTIAVRITATS